MEGFSVLISLYKFKFINMVHIERMCRLFNNIIIHSQFYFFKHNFIFKIVVVEN